MSKLVKINKTFNKDENFWILNPQLIYMQPFSDLYLRDKSKEKIKSSQEMWCIFFLSDPDESENIFYRIPYEQRLQMLKETYYPDLNESDELFEKCKDAYVYTCLSTIERTVKEQKDFLVKRTKALINMEYNIDTMKEIDNAYARNLKINEDFKKVEELFDQSKKELKARGNRALTLSEKKLI